MMTTALLKKAYTSRIYAHFAVELLLLLILVATVATNLLIRANSERTTKVNQSLFFVYLKSHPQINEQLVETYQTVNLKVTQNPQNLTKQLLAASSYGKEKESADQVSSPPLPTLSGSALLKPNPASSDGPLPTKRDIEVYKVRGGDTVGRIASAYGVSINTILWENNLTTTALIQPGQELKILPVSGVKHTIAEGESLSAIAKKYGVDLETILEYNSIEIPEFILPGEQIIIPHGVKPAPLTPQRQQYLAGLTRQDYQTANVPSGYEGTGSIGLTWPQPGGRGISQYYWSRHRGVDAPCRSCEIVAAAGGIVELSGWQGGYGYTIVINHGRGLKTRYAHGSRLLVAAGAQMSQGQPIMISGSTGRSTGAHLHFEVIQNGVFLNPLKVVSR